MDDLRSPTLPARRIPLSELESVGRPQLGQGSYGTVTAWRWNHGDIVPVAVKRFYTQRRALPDDMRSVMNDEVRIYRSVSGVMLMVNQ